MTQFFAPFDSEALPGVAEAFIQGQDMQRRNRLADLQEETARMQLEEAKTAATDRSQLRNRLSELRGGYVYPEPDGVGPMPPGQEASLSQLAPVQQPASQAQIMDVYRQEAGQGNQFAAQSLPGMINLDNALAEYGARVKAGGGDINSYYQQKEQIERIGSVADVLAKYRGNHAALRAAWPQLQKTIPELANLDADDFKTDYNGNVLYEMTTPDGQKVPGAYATYDNTGKRTVYFNKDQTQYKQRTYNQGGTEITEVSNDGGRTWSRLSSAPRYKPSSGGGTSGGVRTSGSGQRPSKPMPPAALKMQQAEIDAIQGAASMNANLDKYYNQLESGQLNLGPLKNWWNRGRNIVGRSNQESRNLQSFRATLEKMRNDSLRLNKGVQTEGDAQRAWNELVDNINDEEVVKQRLREIREINDMAVTLRQENLARIRENYGQGNLALTPRERPASAGPASGPPASGRGTRPGDAFLRKKGLKR